jgi:hypothetical protein
MLLAALAVAAGCRPVPSRQPPAAAPPPPPAPIGTVHTGSSFDKCAAPSIAEMQAWRGTSPYGAVGIYIGGANHGCPAGQPNIGWIDAVLSQGWKLLPLYVGLQAPCSSGAGNKFSTGTASSDAIAAADDAILQANARGLPARNPIYYDLEAYNVSDPACTRAVQDFVSVWSTRLRARGYIPGFYSSANSGIRDVNAMVAITGFDVPDEMWFARWNGDPTLLEAQINPTYWVNHQRHHQYMGGHAETYGGVTLQIDTSSSDGAVVTR